MKGIRACFASLVCPFWPYLS